MAVRCSSPRCIHCQRRSTCCHVVYVSHQCHPMLLAASSCAASGAIPCCTRHEQCAKYRNHLIPQSPHTAITSYRNHLIPQSPHTAITSYRNHLRCRGCCPGLSLRQLTPMPACPPARRAATSHARRTSAGSARSIRLAARSARRAHRRLPQTAPARHSTLRSGSPAYNSRLLIATRATPQSYQKRARALAETCK